MDAGRPEHLPNLARLFQQLYKECLRSLELCDFGSDAGELGLREVRAEVRFYLLLYYIS